MVMKVGEYFFEKGFIGQSDLDEALEFQKTHHRYLGEILLELGKISEMDLLLYLSKRFNVQYISSEKLEKMAFPAPNDIIPESMAVEKNIFPLKYSFNNFRLTYLTYEPQNTNLMNELKFVLPNVQMTVPVVATSKAVKAMILKQYRRDNAAFDRLVKQKLTLDNALRPAGENYISFDEGNNNVDTYRETIAREISEESEERDQEDKRETFSMIANQANMSSNRDVTAISATTLSSMPSWVRESDNQLMEILRIFSGLLDANRGDAFFAHTQRVVALSKEIASAIDLSEIEIHDLSVAAYLHDVGKRLHITALDLQEKKNVEKCREYSTAVTKLFSTIQLPKLSLRCLESVYETYNGTGYPQGLKFSEIPITSLILQLADAYDFMVRISKIPAEKAFEQLKATEFYPERVLRALEETQQIGMNNADGSPKLNAVLICRKKFDLDDIAEKFSRLNVNIIKAKTIESAASLIKANMENLSFILCDVDMPDSAISPLKFVAAVKHKKELAAIPVYMFSQYSVDKNTMATANALNVKKLFTNYHPVEMTVSIVDELKK
ncbi:HD domain-containing protein [bacterium]|nr:HD domain-containing protein [bacterium]